MSSLVNGILDRLGRQVEDEFWLLIGVEKEITFITEKCKVINDVLFTASNRGVKEVGVKKWLQRVENALYDLEEVIDEWDYEKRRFENQGNCLSILPPPSSSYMSLSKLWSRRIMAKKIVDVKGSMERILKEKEEFNFVLSLPQVDDRKFHRSLIDIDKVCGLGLYEKQVHMGRKVIDGTNTHRIMCIVGMGGIGKSTLAKIVYNQMKDRFDANVWISVSSPFDVVGVSRAILGESPPPCSQLDRILEKVMDCVNGKKLLLVLDDMWSEKHDDWEPLRVALSKAAAGSRILVTTRNEGVATMMCIPDQDVYRPEKLSDDDCWAILRRMSGVEGEDFEYIGREIAKKCDGLPLAANLLGSILQSKTTLDDWRMIEQSDLWKTIFPHIMLSYQELSPALKLCFSYGAFYPKDHKIAASDLIREWLSLGYLGPASGREYLNLLVRRSLFQGLGKDNEWCKMHDLVHDFASFLKYEVVEARRPCKHNRS